MLFTRGRDLVINPGTRFDIELTRPMKFSYSEVDFTNAEIDNAERELRQVRPNPSNEGSGNRTLTRRRSPGRIIPGYPF
jgi:hypothetical protein